MFLSTIAVENLRRLGGENSSPGGILDPGARWNHRPAQLADEHDPKHPSEIANLLNVQQKYPEAVEEIQRAIAQAIPIWCSL